MKTLTDILRDRQTALFDKYGVFFAFSRHQFKENIDKYPDQEFVDMGAGMFCLRKTFKEFGDAHAQLVKTAIEEDVAQKGLEAVIERELYNYESFYTGCIEDAWEAMKDYPDMTREKMVKVYNRIYSTVDF